MVHHIVYLQARGLHLSVENGQLAVSPRSRIDPPPAEWSDRYDASTLEAIRQERAALVAYIREHRDEIIRTLASGDIWGERRRAYGEAYRRPVVIASSDPLEVAS